MSNDFHIFSIPGQVAGMDGFVGQADVSLNLDAWSETDGLYLPAEEYEITPDALHAAQHRAADGDGAQGGVHRHLLDLDADALTALTAVQRVPRQPVPAVQQHGNDHPRGRVRGPGHDQQPAVVRDDLQAQLLQTTQQALDAKAEAAEFRRRCAFLEKAYNDLQSASPVVALGTEAPVDTTTRLDASSAAATNPARIPVQSPAVESGADASGAPTTTSTTAGALAVDHTGGLPVQMAPSTEKVEKHFQTRIADTVKLLQSGSSKVDDSTTLAGTRQFVEEIVTATAKLDKHYAALVRAASGLPSQATSTAVAVTGAHCGIRESVIRALDAEPLSSDDRAVVDSVGQAEQLLVRRQRAAMRIVAANAKFHAIDVALAVVLDRRVTGSISEALSDSSSCLQSIAIILSLKGSTAGGRAVDAVDAFTNVPPMAVAASDSFQSRAHAAINRAETRVQTLLEFNMTLPAFAMVKELRVFRKPGPGMDASIYTRWCSDMQAYIDAGQDSFAPLKAKLQKLLSGNPSLANAPGYFAGAAPAVTSAFGVDIKDAAAAQSTPRKTPFKTAARRDADLKAGSPSAKPDGGAQRGRGVSPDAGPPVARGGSRSRDRGSQHAGGRPDNRAQSPGGGRSQPAREHAGVPMQECDLGATCPFLLGPHGCKKRHSREELAAAEAARRDNGSRGSQDSRTWPPRRGPNNQGDRAFRNFSVGLDAQPAADADSTVRANVSFKEALTKDMPAKSGNGNLARRFASPIQRAPPVLKRTTAPPPVNRAEQWARLRTAVLSDAAKHSAAAKNRTVRKHGKTIPAMVDEIDRLYEKLASAAATETPAPRRGITQKQLEAFMADGMPGVWRIVIDTGAEANIVPEDAPLADLQVANALITGASSAVPVVSKTAGNATVVAGTAAQPVHIPVVGGYVVSSLPKHVILLSYARLRKEGFRLIDKPGDEDNIFLMSPTHPTDGKKYRIEVELERHGILTVKTVVSVEARLRQSPSWLQNPALGPSRVPLI
jgi:hypothetical protein